MKKILVPTDFSPPAQWAAEVATEIARKADAEIVLLHVIEEPGPESFNVEGQVASSGDEEEKFYLVQLIRKSRRDLADAAAEIERAGILVSTTLRMGNAFHGIRSIIMEQAADLVVMGTSGRSRLEEMIIGSNTEKVVRYAKCPVLTVHERPSGNGFQNIVYASSLSDDERAFSDVVKNTQAMYSSTIHLLHINTPESFQPDTTVLAAMERFAQKQQLANYTLNIFNHYSEEEGILHFATRIEADLIAMSTHGRKGLAHILAGSIAENVANHSVKPVLTLVSNENDNQKSEVLMAGRK